MPEDNIFPSSLSAIEAACAICEREQSACNCETCVDCGERVAEICSACGECDDCHSLCENCDECLERCECSVCARERCQATVERVCERCEWCNDCCECSYCREGDHPCEDTCRNCESCSECCECWHCEHCDGYYRADDCCGDCESCSECCECSSAIHDYSTDPLEFLSFHGTPAGRLFLGVELEVVVDGSMQDKAEQWNDAADDWFILKHDGSVSHGFEIVTAPSSLDVQKEQWTRLLGDKALVRNLKSWDTSCCGMHVHVSRDAISPLTLGKVLVFMNSASTHRHIVALAGRDESRWAAYTHKTVSDAKHSATTRYEALNLCPTDTVEFRIFKGTLSLEHVLANVEFCDAVVRWAKDASVQDCETWAKFWEYVTKNRKVYKNLLAYMADR